MIDFIHVGLNKTATSWLQKTYFGNHPQLRVLGSRRHQAQINSDYSRLVSSFVQGADLSFDTGKFKAEMERLFAAVKKEESERSETILCSGLSAEAYSGDWRCGKNTRYIAHCLHEMFGRVKIILFLREQMSMLESNYKQFIKRGGTGSLDEFLFSPIRTAGRINYHSPLNTHVVEYFKYSRIVKLYQELFGAENVFIGLYEDLNKAPQSVVDDLSRFLGVEQFPLVEEKRYNVSPSPAALTLLKFFNRFFCTRFHHKYGRLHMMGLFYLVGQGKLKRLADFKDNPYLLQQETSLSLQHKVQSVVIPKIDKVIHRLPLFARKYSIEGLPARLRDFLAEEYRKDNHLLQQLIDSDLKSRGYLL